MTYLVQLILLANTAAFFCSLLGFSLTHAPFSEGGCSKEISTRWRCFEKISHCRFLACFKKRWPTNWLFTPTAPSWI